MDSWEYHLRLARVALHNHGLNPARPEELARWAQAAVQVGYRERGVLVSGDAVVRAQMYKTRRDPMRWPEKREPALPWLIDRRVWTYGPIPAGVSELRHAFDVVREATGLPVAHIVFWEVCEGWVGQ